MDTEGGNFHTITSFNMEEDERGKKKKPKMSRGTPEFNLKLRIFITIVWLCVIALVEYLFIWKLFPELPGEIVGRVRIKISIYNLSYTDDLARSDSIRYKNLSGEFIALVDRRLKNSSLADYYTRSEVDGFENGSVIIKFTSTFKQKNRMLPLMNRIDYVLKNDIFQDKLNITLENTAVVKSKPEIISYDLVRDMSPAIMTPSTPTSSDMISTAPPAENMTDTTATKSTTARTTFISGLASSASITISGTTSSASIAISLVSSTNSATTTTTTTTASTTSVSKTTSSATITPVSTNSTTV